MTNEQEYEKLFTHRLSPMAHVTEGFTPENKICPIWDIDVPDWDAVPFPDLTEVVYRLFFYGRGGRIVVPVEKLTLEFLDKAGTCSWGHLRFMAEKLIYKSGDAHHIFISSFEDMGNGVYQLHTES